MSPYERYRHIAFTLDEFLKMVKVGDKIGQGIFLPFLLTDDDEADGERVGGMGSTGD